jgi:hypothetical protein
MSLNVIEQANLAREVVRLRERISKLESILQGVPIGNVRISDLSADKLTAGNITVKVGVGQSVNGDEINLNGQALRLEIIEGGVLRGIFGRP